MYLYGGELPDTGSWLWADDVIAERETSTPLGVMQVEQRDPAEEAREAAEREKAAAAAAVENRKARRAFVKTQPPVTVTYAALHSGRELTLADALADVFAEYQAARNLATRTVAHEQHLVDRHLAALKPRRVQDVTATELARLLHTMRDRYSPWTCVAVHRILRGSFQLAMRRGILTRSPVDGLADSERPRQANARRVAVLDRDATAHLVTAGSSERWRVALALAGYAGLRLGEIRAVTWADIDLDAGTVTVLLVEWKVRSPHSRASDLVIATADVGPSRNATCDARSTTRRPPQD